MSQFEVSVIIPIYNVASCIECCLQSVMKQQSVPAVECLLIDDCGEDDSMAIAERLIDAYEGPIAFRTVHHQQNRGLSAARNTGIREAQGTYLYFLDADDWVEPDALKLMLELAHRYPDAQMVLGGAMIQGGEPKPWLSLKDSRLPEYLCGRTDVEHAMLDREQIPVTAWNRLIRREFVIEKGLFFEEGLTHEDELWTFLLSQHLSSLALLKENVYHYVWREEGIMSRCQGKEGQSLIRIAQKMIEQMGATASSDTIRYIIGFIKLRSFNIKDEVQRCAMVSLLQELFPYRNTIEQMKLALWMWLAKKEIRRHYWLYTVLYHWR